jgi:hypothetical protein
MGKMTAITFGSWARLAAEFLSYNMPYDDEVGWLHSSNSAFIAGCDALIALGQASATERGARPRRFPEHPNPPPLWDDMAVAIILVAIQSGQLFIAARSGATKATDDIDHEGTSFITINNAQGLSTAYSSINLYPVLTALGLVEAGQWTSSAETLLLRASPRE